MTKLATVWEERWLSRLFKQLAKGYEVKQIHPLTRQSSTSWPPQLSSELYGWLLVALLLAMLHIFAVAHICLTLFFNFHNFWQLCSWSRTATSPVWTSHIGYARHVSISVRVYVCMCLCVSICMCEPASVFDARAAHPFCNTQPQFRCQF